MPGLLLEVNKPVGVPFFQNGAEVGFKVTPTITGDHDALRLPYLPYRPQSSISP